RFDLRAELLKNGVTISSGEAHCITNVTRNPASALKISVPFGAVPPTQLSASDTFALRVSTRIGTNANGSSCGGHANAVGLRLYFDSLDRPAQFTTYTD